MTYTPNQISVQPGDRLVIELVNDDPLTVHDLSIAGRATPRLAPGERAELDLGVITESAAGLVHHRRTPSDGHGPRRPGQWAGRGRQPGPASDTHHASGPVTVPNVPDAALGSHVDPALAPLGPSASTGSP